MPASAEEPQMETEKAPGVLVIRVVAVVWRSAASRRLHHATAPRHWLVAETCPRSHRRTTTSPRVAYDTLARACSDTVKLQGLATDA